MPAFTRKFLLAAALTVLPISLIPEVWFGPLNGFTARRAGEVIQLLGVVPLVRGTALSVGGFTVNVIAECSAVHLVALYAAFIVAFPARRPAKWIGLAAGTSLLFLANIVRIAGLTLTGWRFPGVFEIIHIYFGQLGMLLATVVACLVWSRWASRSGGMPRPLGFLLRFLAFSSLPFLIWIDLNTRYVATLDNLINGVLGMFSFHLEIRHAHRLYYQTFSLIALGGLLMAVKGATPAMRLRWMAFGLGVLSLLQIALRLCNAGITAFQIQWMVPVAQVVYHVCVYVLPIAVATGFFMRVRDRPENAA